MIEDRRYAYMDSPIGRLLLWGDGRNLEGIELPRDGQAARPQPAWREDPPAFAGAVAQLREYFAGRRRAFDLPLRPRTPSGRPGTGFQQEVWARMAEIPYGQTVSYGELARRVGRPAAFRAVGAACGHNPLPIIIPCHRVVGSDGGLTGYGGGLEIKRRLLELESGRSAPVAGGSGKGSR